MTPEEAAELDRLLDKCCAVRACQKPLTWREWMRGFCAACGTVLPRK